MAALVTAAAAEFADVGYEAATMSAIARRAGAPIGSLYQFFSNKEALARALRTEYAREYEQLSAPLDARAAAMTLPQLVEALVKLMFGLARRHPAFLTLLDAPSATRIPASRERHRQWVARLLLAHTPQLSQQRADQIATVVTQINRGMLGLYAEGPPAEREWVIEEAAAVLVAYLTRCLAD